MKKLLVRNVELKDLDVCSVIESECYPAVEAASRENIRKRITIYPEGFLVLELDGAVVGLVNSGATNKDDISDEEFKALIGHEPRGKNMVIFSLAVQPKHQGNGFSRILMDSFIQRAAHLGKARVLLLCKRNLIGYYKTFGFQDYGESLSQHGGARWNEMRLVVEVS